MNIVFITLILTIVTIVSFVLLKKKKVEPQVGEVVLPVAEIPKTETAQAIQVIPKKTETAQAIQVIPKKTEDIPPGLNYISGSPKSFWKYTEDPNDPECATNWNYYEKDGKTLIAAAIQNITNLHDNKNWCALKTPDTFKYVSGSPRNFWKYTDDPNDPECATNWNYYEKDGKTLIAAGIQNITNLRDNKNWCPVKNIKNIIQSPPPQVAQQVIPSAITVLNVTGPPGTPNTVLKSSGINYVSGSPKSFWKYTDDPNDPECATNWNYLEKDGKTIIASGISNITKLRDNKNWCAVKNPGTLKYISGSPKSFWKYTDNPNDPDCLNNWDYLEKDGKTIIAAGIPNITKLRDNKNWCAIKQ